MVAWAFENTQSHMNAWLEACLGLIMGSLDLFWAALDCPHITPKAVYVKLTDGQCPSGRQVSKDECLAAAKAVGADASKTQLDGGADAGLNGRPQGCTLHNWGNVEWWGPSDDAACGSLNYNCVCKEAGEAAASR